MHLMKYYRNAVVLPAIFIVAFYLLYIAADGIFAEEYESEWMTKAGINLTLLGIVFLNSLFICILATALFCNARQGVKNNIILSSLAWFFLPMLWIAYLWFSHLFHLVSDHKSPDANSLFIFSNTLPQLVGLIVTFRQFRQRMPENSIRLTEG